MGEISAWDLPPAAPSAAASPAAPTMISVSVRPGGSFHVRHPGASQGMTVGTSAAPAVVAQAGGPGSTAPNPY
eukprot:7958562-Alexandrium_andersonii.AAC.1